MTPHRCVFASPPRSGAPGGPAKPAPRRPLVSAAGMGLDLEN
jgi:hypothetical protein